MKKTVTLFTLLAFACFAARASFVPVALTGFNEDVIVNGSGPSTSSVSADLTSTYNGIDNDNYALVAQDYVDPDGNTPTYFLPTGGLVTSVLTSGLTFQLADYSSNNALYLPAVGDTGILSFVTPQSAGSIYITGLSAGGSSEFDLTVNFSDGTTQTFSNNEFNDWYNTPPPASVPGIGRVGITNGQIDPFVTNQNPHLFELGFTLDPSNFSKTITGIKVSKTNPNGFDNGYLLVMGVTANTVCTGTPTPGTVAATQTVGCQEYFPTLTMAGGATTDGGMAYQWQYSTDSATWTNAVGATNSSYTPDVTSPIYYRDSITCLNSNSEAVTPGILLGFTTPEPVPATLPYFQGFESWIGTCYNFDRPDNSWILDPTYDDNSFDNDSWRRDDQGSDAGWQFITNGAYTPTSTEGSHSARWHTSEAEFSSGSMTLYADFSTVGTKSISFDYINTGDESFTFEASSLTVSISTDSVNWTTLGTLGNQINNWENVTYVTSVVSPHAMIKFEANNLFDFGDMGIDSLNITMLPACSGTPDAGTITATQTSGCSEYTPTLSSTAAYITGGLTFQWKSSTDGGVTYSDVSNATDVSYVPDITATTYYELVVTCTASGNSATTPAVELQYVVPAPTYATLPYFQGFESWIGTCSLYDRPDNSWTTWPQTGNASWRRDDQGSDAGWSFPNGGAYTPASTELAHSARFHTIDAEFTSGTLNLYADFSGTGTKAIMFDYINAGDETEFDMSNMTVSISTDSVNFTTLATYSNNTPNWTPEVILTDITAPHVIIQFQGNPDFDYPEDMGIDSVSVSLLPSCNGTPVAGPTNTTQGSGCSEFFPTLSINVDYTAGGYTYQWYSSTDGTNFTQLPNATDPTYNADITANTYFYCQVTCTASTLSDTSAHLEEIMTAPVATFATLPYFQGFENWIGTCYTYDRPDISWMNTPTYGNNSWRRDDQGSDAGWSFPNDGTYSPASTELAHSARFHSEESFNPGDLDLYVDLSPAGSKLITFDFINANENESFEPSSMTVMISTDSTNWTTLGTYQEVDNWTQEAVSTSITSPHTIIRFEGSSEFTYPDMGIDSVSVSILPPCAGMPVAGTFSNTQTLGCLSYIDTMTVDAPVYASGISYQWQSSLDGNTWTSIANATNLTYMTPSITASTYYRFYVKCAVSADSAFSDTTELVYTPETITTATLPYFQSFESWVGGACYAFDRPDSSWEGLPNVGDNSWRRNDQGSNGQWHNIGSGSYSPASTDASHSARFHSYWAPDGAEGDLDLHVDLSATGTKQIKFDFMNQDGFDPLNIELSEDGGATFNTTLLTLEPTDYEGWQTEYVNTTSTAANAVIRFAAISDFGGTDIGIDSLAIQVLPACDGTPTAGTFSATQTSGCVAYATTMSVDNPVNESNITYQWQSSADGTTWGSIGGATNLTYDAGITATIYYRFIVKCTGSGDSDISAATEFILQPEVANVATLNYFQGFENWTGYCNPTDRPDTNWIQTFTTGDDSWARDDQGDNAGWGAPFGGEYSPTSTELDHSARFHSYLVFPGDEGDLDLHLNLNYPGTKTITFDYMNEDGDDYVNLELSEDSGANFTTLATLQSSDYTGIYDWQPQSFTITSVSPHAVLRFAGNGDFGNSDIGIDSLLITAPTCDTVSDLTVAAFGQTNASITWAASGAAGYQVLVNTVSANPASGNNTTANSDVETNLTPGTTYYAHVRDSCGPGLFSAWTTVSFTTLSCDSITNLQVTVISDSMATITWTSIGGTQGYEYSIATTATTPTAGTGIATNSVTSTTLAGGTHYYVFVRDSCGPNNFSAWDTLSFNTFPEGIASVNGNFNVDAYPNPAKDIVTVRAYGQKGANRKVSLTDVAGRVIEEENMTTDRVDFNMANLASGIYLIRYEDDDHTRVIKLNKQ